MAEIAAQHTADTPAIASGVFEPRAAQTTFERTEEKYLLTHDEYLRVRELLGPRCHDDEFARSTISSLYYDDAQFTMINRSIERPYYKQKIRVRAYGPSTGDGAIDLGHAQANADAPRADQYAAVFVELKKKLKGITYKRRFPATVEGAHAFLSGMPYEQVQSTYPLADERKRAAAFSWKNRQIAREIEATVARYGHIEPKIMVVVDRVALRANDRSDLRITFDLDTRYRTDRLGFDEGIDGTPLFATGSLAGTYAIMEIKCAKAYPLWLVRMLSQEKLYCRPCSKVGNAYMLSHPAQAPRISAATTNQNQAPRANHQPATSWTHATRPATQHS